MIAQLKTKLGRTGIPLWIAGVAFAIALLLGISKTNMEVILFKFMIFCPAVALTHAIRLTLFPYIDLSDVYDSVIKSKDEQIDAAILFSAIVFLYVALTYTLVSAI